MKSTINFKNILKFSKLLNDFRLIQRVILVNGEDRLENDVEHSYMLAMLSWYIINSYQLRFNLDKVFQYALVHDFVEVYAGDTYLYTKDIKHKNNKKQREKKAIRRLKKEFKEFSSLYKCIENYEFQKDKESRFIYALDKLQPILNIYLDKGRTWKVNGITLDMLIDAKTEKISKSPVINKCFNEFLSILKKDKRKLFSNLK